MGKLWRNKTDVQKKGTSGHPQGGNDFIANKFLVSPPLATSLGIVAFSVINQPITRSLPSKCFQSKRQLCEQLKLTDTRHSSHQAEAS